MTAAVFDPAAVAAADELFAKHGPDWLAAVSRRRSRRAFDGLRVDSAKLDALEDVCNLFRPYDDARAVLVRNPDIDIFTGLIGSYGKVRNAPHVLVFIGRESGRFDHHAGFTGEAVVLEATSLGLDTCWIGGFFSAPLAARLVDLAPGERIVAVSPVGYGTDALKLQERGLRGFSGANRRKGVAEIAPSMSAGWPEWAVAAVETARFAPSAMNRQPWRFRVDAGALVIARDTLAEVPRVTKRLDCGIAMLHAQLGARACGAMGAWRELNRGRDIARYVPLRDGATEAGRWGRYVQGELFEQALGEVPCESRFPGATASSDGS